MVAKISRQMGKTVGLTNTSGVYINDEKILDADASGPKSARMVLRDPTVDVAVLETARGGMLREGLAFDRCDVGIVLNVTADHLGLKGVDTLEDLAAVKSIVTEAVSRRGVSVLNGDDPLTLRMARHAGGRIAYFTLEGGPEMSPFLQKHIAEGGLVVARERSMRGGDLVIHDRGARTFVVHGDEIPATSGAWPNSTSPTPWRRSPPATPWAPPQTIAEALKAFTSSHTENPGASTSTTPTAFGSSSTTRTTPAPCGPSATWSSGCVPASSG
jgi:cyanophycin synthetase